MQDPISSREYFDLRTVDLKIEDVAFGGKGVGRENGKAVFVPFTIDGEMISAQITREKKQFAEAELVDLQERSPHRVNPECPYFGRCGGCSYQHIDYEYQLAIKWRQVRDVLQRIGKLKDIPMRPIIPSPISYAYRNRITVHAQDGVIGQGGRHVEREPRPGAREKFTADRTPVARKHALHHVKSFKLAAGCMAKNSKSEAMPNMPAPPTSRSSPSSTRS